MAAPVTVVSINPASTRPLSVSALDPIVALTINVVEWQPAAAIGGVAQMSVVLSEAVSSFAIRCNISRTPVGLAAAAPASCLTLNFQDVQVLVLVKPCPGPLLVMSPPPPLAIGPTVEHMLGEA